MERGLDQKSRVWSETKRVFDQLVEMKLRWFHLDDVISTSGKTYQAAVSLLDHLTRAGWVRVERGWRLEVN